MFFREVTPDETLEVVTIDNDAIREFMKEFPREEQPRSVPLESYHIARATDPTDSWYCVPAATAWRLSQMLEKGYALVGTVGNGYFFAKKKSAA